MASVTPEEARRAKFKAIKKRGRKLELELYRKGEIPKASHELRNQLTEVRRIMKADREVKRIAQHVKGLLEDGNRFPEHGQRHAMTTGYRAGMIAGLESRRLGIYGKQRKKLMKESIIAGILHDVGREQHGRHEKWSAVRARVILEELKIKTRYVVPAIGEHEELEWTPSGVKKRDLVSGSLFDADKMRWGVIIPAFEGWKIGEKAGFSIEEAKKLAPEQCEMLKRANFRTSVGKEYGPKLVDAGQKIGQKLIKELNKKPREKRI